MAHPMTGVRSRRTLKGVHASSIARELGITVESYRRLERGERRMYLDKAITLSHILGCTVEQLGQEPSLDEQLEATKRNYTAKMTGITDPTLQDELEHWGEEGYVSPHAKPVEKPPVETEAERKVREQAELDRLLDEWKQGD